VDREERLHTPFTLTLEPPSPRVFVDVEVQFRQAVPEAESKLRSALREALAEVEDAAGTLPLAYDALRAKLPVDVRDAAASLRFLVVHTRDGRAAELAASGAEDALEAREKPELRHVLLAGGAP
jgi:hypothetical protein